MLTADQYKCNCFYYKPDEDVLGPIQQLVFKENQPENTIYDISLVC